MLLPHSRAGLLLAWNDSRFLKSRNAVMYPGCWLFSTGQWHICLPRLEIIRRLFSGITTPWASSRRVSWIPTWPSCRGTELPVSCNWNNLKRYDGTVRSQSGRQVFPRSSVASCFFMFIRPKMRLKRHRDAILTASSPSSVSTRLLCWKTMQREVLGKYPVEESSH